MLAEKEKTRRGRAGLYITVILISAAVFSIAAFYVLRGNAAFAERAERNFALPVRSALGSLSSRVKFSVAEAVCAFALVIFVIYAAVGFFRIKQSEQKWREAARRILTLALCTAYIWSAFCWLWGMAGSAPKISESAAFSQKNVTVEDLEAVTSKFLSRANALTSQMERDADGGAAVDIDALIFTAPTLYDGIREEFALPDAPTPVPKRMAFTRTMSALGITGFYFPLTGEAHINADAPAATVPFTAAHELAHALGIASEQECNFLGIAACLVSNDAAYEYSGCLCGLIYLMNALRKSDIEAWTRLRSEFSPQLEADWRENAAYCSAVKSRVKTVSDSFYDGYLKSSGQPLGMLSYDACVELLVLYYRSAG
ncbi:MAG: DUF3810 domain-containing protein [Oscillospiraceae bacterium]|nr:DUF3810 domain-containing protein [Oscillospiraceae bacterium]